MSKGPFKTLNGYEVKDEEARRAAGSASESAAGLMAAVNGIRRKVNGLSNTLVDIVVNRRAEQKKERCTVYSISSDESLVNIRCSTGDEMRQISIRVVATDESLYEITHLSGYRVTKLFTTGTATKTFLGVWLDGTKHDSIDVLKDTSISFKSLVVAYSIACDDYTINVCYTVNAYGFTVYESIPETLEECPLVVDTVGATANSNYNAVYSDDPFHSVFAIANAEKKRIYIESVVAQGQSVVKKIDFTGGY